MSKSSKLCPILAEFSITKTQRISGRRLVGGPGVETLWRGMGDAPAPGEAMLNAGEATDDGPGVGALALALVASICEGVVSGEERERCL